MLLGGTLFSASYHRLLAVAAQVRILSIRLRLQGVQFFECAAAPRLTGEVRYSTPVLLLIAVFLLYDLDLVFFLAEVLAYVSLW